MYICNCNGLTERTVDDSIADGARSVEDVFEQNGCAPRCELCAPEIEERLQLARGGEEQFIETSRSSAIP